MRNRRPDFFRTFGFCGGDAGHKATLGTTLSCGRPDGRFQQCTYGGGNIRFCLKGDERQKSDGLTVALKRPQEQRRLIAEQSIEARFGNADGAGDTIDVDSIVSVRPKQFDGRIERCVWFKFARSPWPPFLLFLLPHLLPFGTLLLTSKGHFDIPYCMVANFGSEEQSRPAKGKIALITGANGGIGKDVARQLALTRAYRKILLACRNRSKAERAKRDLETATGKSIFEIVLMDVSDLTSVRAVLSSLKDQIDDLVMNAGGSGGKTPLALTEDRVTQIFASNVLGHVVLLEGLIASGQLAGAAVFAGSEAARGVPEFGMKRPALTTFSAGEFASFCDGTYFRNRKADGTLAYGQVKLVGAMWMSSVARRNPDLRLITMSPGNTSGTEVARDFPLPVRFMMKYILMPIVMPLFGIVQGVDKGAKRLIDGLNDDALKSGVFYASKAGALTGPVIDQSQIFGELANTVYQDNASAAVHRFT